MVSKIFQVETMPLWKVFKKSEWKKWAWIQNLQKFFESIKKRSKKLHFSNLFLKYKHNIKKTWEVIKESLRKGKCNHQNFPKKNKVDKINITDEDLKVKQFSTYFTEIGPTIARTIQASSPNFSSFMENCNSTLA